MEEPCQPVRRVVAKGPVCSIEECTCGVLHVTIGALTIRLQGDVVESIHDTLGEALEKLAIERHTRAVADGFAAAAPSAERPS